MKTHLALFVALLVAGVAAAADWPQWRGLDRDDVSKETGLLTKWPEGGPKLVWTCEEAGIGYGGFAVVGDRLYTCGGDETDNLMALDVATGKKVWSSPIGPFFKNGYGDGPRGTPSVDGKHIYVIGGQGILLCAETDGGKKVWAVDLKKDLGGQMMSGWGYCESPLVDGDRVLCTPGADRGAVAARDAKTGEVVWRSKGVTDKAAYSSLVIGNAGGIKQYVQMTGDSVFGVAADDGRLLWRFPRTSRTAAIPTPIVKDDYVYVSSGYGAGECFLKINTDPKKAQKAEEVYRTGKLENHHGGVLRIGGHVYGHSQKGGWMCQELMSGKIAWADSRALGKGSVTAADGRLYMYSEDKGTCVLAEATPTGFKEAGRFTIPRATKVDRQRGKIWTHPVVANGKLYLRDQDLIFCFDVKQ